MPEEFSATGRLRPHQWSNEETAAYEGAIEAVNAVVGAYSARIAQEEAQQVPDLDRIAAAKAARTELARERERLVPTDHAAIAAARRHYAELAAAVREGRA